MMMDISYGWIKENLLIFTVSPDIGATSSITGDIIFVQQLFSAESTIWGYIFTEHFFKKNYPMISHEGFGTPS